MQRRFRGQRCCLKSPRKPQLRPALNENPEPLALLVEIISTYVKEPESSLTLQPAPIASRMLGSGISSESGASCRR
jgi:hypothetical protein